MIGPRPCAYACTYVDPVFTSQSYNMSLSTSANLSVFLVLMLVDPGCVRLRNVDLDFENPDFEFAIEREIRKRISTPGAYTFQRPFLRGLYSEGLIYAGKFAFQNRLG